MVLGKIETVPRKRELSFKTLPKEVKQSLNYLGFVVKDAQVLETVK